MPLSAPDPHARLAGERAYGAARSLLITLGVLAGGWLFARPGPEGILPTHWLVPLGIVLQLAMIAARAFIRRVAPDPATAAQGFLILEIIGDGVTVLLFALGLFGPYLAMFDNL